MISVFSFSFFSLGEGRRERRQQQEGQPQPNVPPKDKDRKRKRKRKRKSTKMASKKTSQELKVMQDEEVNDYPLLTSWSFWSESGVESAGGEVSFDEKIKIGTTVSTVKVCLPLAARRFPPLLSSPRRCDDDGERRQRGVETKTWLW